MLMKALPLSALELGNGPLKARVMPLASQRLTAVYRLECAETERPDLSFGGVFRVPGGRSKQ
jgi:hypothetical protein